MVSITQANYIPQGDKMYIQGACLSTDSKPTSCILNGSCLIEMDTSKVYFYDEAGTQWLEFGGNA